MDALLTALLGCFLGEMGDKGQLLLAALAARFGRPRAVIAGAAAAVLANATIAAATAAFIIPMLGSDARLLFLALAVLFLGVAMLWRVKAPDPLADWPTGPFVTAALGLFILGFGEGSQFLILGIATRTADPVMAAAGGAIGMMAALVPAILLREALVRHAAVRAVRRVAGVLMLLIALRLGVTALGLA
ncbi:TMEM165/GDT1 family protein [Sphingobium mellinum]|uniref:TMEM165/GDT1 family protein n=1 Tax=Sphingobium mellinum TaxID=1387166 RepID=UPI0030EDD626